MFFAPFSEKEKTAVRIAVDGVAMWLAQKRPEALRAMNPRRFDASDVRRHISFGLLERAERDREIAGSANLSAKRVSHSGSATENLDSVWEKWGLPMPCFVPAPILKELRTRQLNDLPPLPENKDDFGFQAADLITLLRYLILVGTPESVIRFCLNEWCV